MSALHDAARRVVAAWVSTRPAWIEQCNEAVLELDAALKAQPEPAQQDEPVLVVEKEPDYWSGGHFHQGSKSHIDHTKVWSLPIGAKLYTAPPQRPPLTDEEIYSLFRTAGSPTAFARAIERKVRGEKE